MQKELWLDIRKLSKEQIEVLVPLATNNGYTGIFMMPEQKEVMKMLPKQTIPMVFATKAGVPVCKKLAEEKKEIIFFAESMELLQEMEGQKGMFLHVDDRASLDKTVEITGQLKNVIIDFKATTNIPLELVLAFSQKNHCKIIKKVTAGEDGWIASMVMEMGSHGILLETFQAKDILLLKEKLESLEEQKLNLQELTVIESKHIGMGDRVCIDTTSILNQDEGFILGSTSDGGILVSSETHFLPYMELRPFRVNAGAVHLYAWNKEDKTDYLSELKGGSQMMAVDSKGNVRTVAVGRVKIERRPMLLVRAKDKQGIEVNVVLQDDWHVRVIGVKGEPLNCTELKPGDKVLGYTCESGRHVGIKINEHIIEK